MEASPDGEEQDPLENLIREGECCIAKEIVETVQTRLNKNGFSKESDYLKLYIEHAGREIVEDHLIHIKIQQKLKQKYGVSNYKVKKAREYVFDMVKTVTSSYRSMPLR